jgi:hypothetical protein
MKWFLLFCSLTVASANPLFFLTPSPPAGGGGEEPTLLLQEGFEGTGYENVGWTTLGDGNPDSTTAPETGSHCFGHDGSTGGANSPSHAAATKYRWIGTVRVSTVGAANRSILKLLATDGTTELATVQVNGSGVVTVTHGTASQVTGLTFVAPQRVYWWIEYEVSSGADDGILRFYTAASNVQPGSPDVTISNGTSTSGIAEFTIGGNSTSQPTAQWDDISTYAY